MTEYFFKCGLKDKPLTNAGLERVKKIIDSSKIRGDNLHEQLQHKIETSSDVTVEYHRSCVSSYTSSSHINRYVQHPSQSSAGAKRR